jgi:hypothetical protein
MEKLMTSQTANELIYKQNYYVKKEGNQVLKNLQNSFTYLITKIITMMD